MNELELINNFRKICGDVTNAYDGFLLTVGALEVPNFIETDEEMNLPEIIITPFISDNSMAKTTVYCPAATPVRNDFELKHARFQVDIYAKNIVDLLKIKSALETRINDFVEAELFVFKEPTGWEAYDSNIYVNNGYNTSQDIVKLKELTTALIKKQTLEELTTPGTWYLDNTGIYVYPFNNLSTVEFTKRLNGLVLSDGTTAYGAGIQFINPVNSRKLSDEDPKVERWSMDFMVSYRVLRPRNLGTKIEEINLNVQED